MVELKGNVEYLTHYTNIDSLKKILDTRSFKFNAARHLNDNLEGRTCDSDIPIEYMMYSSSWCEDLSDNGIAYMWDNYTSADGGVRIFAPKHIFKKIDICTDNNKTIKTYLPCEYHKDFMSSDRFSKFLYKIEYTDKKEIIKPNIKYKDGHWDQYDIYKLGRYKQEKWSIEQEWRYCLFLVSRNMVAVDKESRGYMSRYCYPDAIFIKFKYSIYKKMIVQAGRHMTKENRVALYELAKKYKFNIIDID